MRRRTYHRWILVSQILIVLGLGVAMFWKKKFLIDSIMIPYLAETAPSLPRGHPRKIRHHGAIRNGQDIQTGRPDIPIVGSGPPAAWTEACSPPVASELHLLHTTDPGPQGDDHGDE